MDIDILLWFQELRNPALNALGYGLTFVLAEESVLLVVLCCMYWCFAKREALLVIFSFFAGMWLNCLLKVTFCVPRPWLRDPRVQPYAPILPSATGYSFPSGHTAYAVAVYGGFALLAWKKKRWAGILFWVIALLIGLSRLYFGVHAPQDVLVSLGVGLPTLLLIRAMMEAVRRQPERDVWVLAGGLLLAAALLVYTRFKPYPPNTEPSMLADGCKTAGALAGMLLGWFLERRYVGFELRRTWKTVLARTALGVAGLMALRFGLKSVCAALLGDGMGDVARYFAVALWAIWLWPLIFTRAQKRMGK